MRCAAGSPNWRTWPMTSEPMTSESFPPEPTAAHPTARGPVTFAAAAPAPGPTMVESGSHLPSAMGVAVPDTRLHPIYLVTETANTLRQAIPFLMVTILGGAPWQV